MPPLSLLVETMPDTVTPSAVRGFWLDCVFGKANNLAPDTATSRTSVITDLKRIIRLAMSVEIGSTNKIAYGAEVNLRGRVRDASLPTLVTAV